MPFLAPIAARKLARAIRQRESRHWLVFVSTLDFNFPFRQRGHHLVRAFRRHDQPVIFVTRAAGYDRVSLIAEIGGDLVLTPHRNAAIEAVPRPLVYFASTDADVDARTLEQIRNRGGRIIYDYVDLLDDRLSTGPLSDARRQVHHDLLADDSAICIVTAERLFEEVAACRQRNFCPGHEWSRCRPLHGCAFAHRAPRRLCGRRRSSTTNHWIFWCAGPVGGL